MAVIIHGVSQQIPYTHGNIVVLQSVKMSPVCVFYYESTFNGDNSSKPYL